MSMSLSAIPISFVAAATILGVHYMNLSVKRPEPEIHVDTVYSITHDTVVSRARDTMKIVVREIGPLTEQMIARVICGDKTYGDKRDTFGWNAYGMIFCPKGTE